MYYNIIKYMLILLLIILPVDAHAYLNPGTGSYIIQVTLALILGGLFLVKVYYKKIKSYILKIFKTKKDDE